MEGKSETTTRDCWFVWEDDDGAIHGMWWPFCEIPGCPNRICIGKSDRFCWPHSGSGRTLKQIIGDTKRRKKKRVKELEHV